LWLSVCLCWAEKLMNVNCNNLLNIDAFGIGSLKKLINNQDGSIVVGSLLKDDKVRKSVKELMKRLSFGAWEKSRSVVANGERWEDQGNGGTHSDAGRCGEVSKK
jgi:hypothetical protein